MTMDTINDIKSEEQSIQTHKTQTTGEDNDEPLDVKIFWYQIVISVGLGLSMYYLIMMGFPLKITTSDPIGLILTTGYWLIIWIYLILLFGVPFVIFRLKTGNRLITCLKRTVRTSGTQITLFLTLSALIFMLNI